MIDIKELSLEEKIGQMIGLAFYGTTYNDELKFQIEEVKAGLIIYFKDNCQSPKQIFELNKEIYKHAKIVPFISLDQEGGMVARVTEGITQSPGAMPIRAGSNSDVAYHLAYNMGYELKKIGFNFNFAPVSDINNNPLNPVINVRSYSEDPNIVTEYMAKANQGYNDAGLMTSLKHFPGHGDTAVDSHLGLPVVNFDEERLNKMELVPYLYAIKNKLPGIMASHILYENIDNEYPTTLSKKVIQKFLREKLGFDGLVVTDSLTMKAVWGRYSIEEIVFNTFNSGCDIMLLCGARDIKMQKEFYETAIRLAKEGKIDLDMIDRSVERILKCKERFAVSNLDILNQEYADIEKELNNASRIAYSREAMDRSVTLICDDNKLLPLRKEEKILMVVPKMKVVTLVENDDKSLKSIAEYLSFKVDKIYLEIDPTDDEASELKKLIDKYDKIVYCSYNACFNNKQAELINSLPLNKLIVVALRTPYDYNVLKATTYLTAYEASHLAYQSLSKVLEGKLKAQGICPVKLNKK